MGYTVIITVHDFILMSDPVTSVQVLMTLTSDDLSPST